MNASPVESPPELASAPSSGSSSSRAKEQKPFSLRRKLIGTVLLVELAAALFISGLALIYERHAHFRTFDIMLRGRADSVFGAVQDADDPSDNIMLDKNQLEIPPDDVYEVREESGRVLGVTRNWSGAPPDAISDSNDGFVGLRVRGRAYRGLRLHGLRVVDPGQKGAGIARHITIFYGSPTAAVWKAVAAAAEFYAAANLLLLLVTGLVMAWLLNRGLAPLRLLAAEASGVSVTSWQFHPPAAALKMKELAPLAIALEAVLGGLERSFGQQRRFVGDAAHELKTAVAVVKSSLQLLAMKPRSSEEYQEGLERCEADCDRMEEIVYKMLILARLDSATGEPVAGAATDLPGCVRSVADQFESMARLRRVRVALSIQETAPVAIASHDCQLLVSNLVLNALQHSYPESEVALSVRRVGSDLAELLIEDHGHGIDAAALPHVFERFFRGDASRDRRTGGTGLGLAICKAIVDQSSGKIAIESKVGSGTAVRVRLPLAPRAASALAATQVSV